VDNLKGLITNVQRFSIHDGPGIRTTVFFKGCPLRCFWCHNPETWRLKPEVQVFPDRCIDCGVCFERCPQGAHVMVDCDGRVVPVNGGPPKGESSSGEEDALNRRFLRDLCQSCGTCVDTCYAEALVMAGKWWTPEELLEELLRDQPFYEQSGGGITLSGGEPLMQQAFSLRVLQLCRAAGLHTAIETAAPTRWRDLAELLPWLDLVMMDIKLIDEGAHRDATGISNRLVLENARRLAETDMPLIVRTPVIPTVNDNMEAIGAVAQFVRDFPNLLYYELMPFHRLAEGKYRSLDIYYQARDFEPPAREQMEALAEHARATGVRQVKVG
jgi:pyruvate formate lyase activating enzyme